MNKVYNERTPSWTEPVEHFVGLLRNVQSANSKDVKLYLADHKKLIAKLNKVVHHAKTMNLQYVEGHLAALNACQSKYKEATTAVQGGMTEGHIRPIIDWSLIFGEYCDKVLRVTEY